MWPVYFFARKQLNDRLNVILRQDLRRGSEKTSIRTKTALGQLVEAGGFKGGVVPYGYDLVKSGRVNKKKHELNELAVNEEEAAVVRLIFDKLVRRIFERMRAVSKSEIIALRYREKMLERKSLLQTVRNEYRRAAAELESLRGEVIKSIQGESVFSKELLGSLISGSEAKCGQLKEQLDSAQASYDEGEAVMASLNAQYDDIISWADMYDTASIEAKKMIINCLIKRIYVYRGYKLKIEFNIDFEQFNFGADGELFTVA